MDRRQKSVVILLGIFLLGYILFPLLPDKSRPIARQGVLDLSGWSFANGTVKLDGQWEWIPNEFVAAGQPAALPAAGLIDVPGAWDKSFDESRSTSIGSGTYRLQVILPEHTPSYLAVRVTNIRTSHDLYINGNKVGSSGTPSLHPDRYVPRNHTYIAGTEITGRKLEVVVHVANYTYFSGGGLFQPVWIGDMQSISRMKSLSVGADMTTAIVFCTIGLISALTYLLFHRRRELLVFALLNISVMQFVLTHGEKLLYEIWPEIGYEALTKMQLFSTIQMIGCIVSLVSILHYRRWERIVGRVVQLGCAIYGIALLLLPVAMFTQGIYTITATTAGYLFIFYTLFRAVWSNHRHSFFIIISTLGALASSLNQLLNETDIRKPTFDPSIEYVIFIVGLVLLLFDTYVKALADARKLSQSLIRSDQQKKEFLANTSYELRTPIHTMMNLCHTLLLDSENGFAARQRQDMKTIEAIGRRMSRLLDDMLDLAATNEGKLQFATERISVKPVVSAAVEMLLLLINDKPIRVVNLVPDGIAVLADEGRLVQMLTHLISNAILRLSEGTITVRAERKDDDVWITVHDEGTYGLTEHLAARQEMEDERGRKENHGVRVTRQLAELHGGTIEERVDADNGSLYVLSLPSAPWSPKSEVQLRSNTEYFPGSPVHLSPNNRPVEGEILIVAEESLNLQMMVKLLQAEHYDVTVLSYPEHVIELLQGHFPYDLVLLDVSLPTMSGYKLCRLIRQRFSDTELPILLVTANGRAEDAAAGFDAGANDYIMKPIDPVECSARIRGAMHLRKSIEERIKLELALVQAQLKPHFLYNTLNTIAALSEIDHDRTRALLMHFGEYLRASFDKRNLEPLVPFEKELELVRNYLHIEQTRFGERLKIEYAGVDIVRFLIPPLTLQPLVENAIRHGLMKKSGGGTLRIEVEASPEYIVVSVIDDGAGIDPARVAPLLGGAEAGGIGLYNTHKRLLHTFGQGLSIRHIPAGGTQVSIRIPQKNE